MDFPAVNQYSRSIGLKKTINCDYLKLWKIISEKSNLELFHPFCKKNNVIKWSSNDSIDEIEYLNGSVFRRKFYNWIEKEGYDLYIGAHGKPKSHVSWRIKKDDLKTHIKITIHPYLFNLNNHHLNLVPYYLMVKPLMAKYLHSVLNGLKFYAEFDRIVSKNQFGRHIWFS